MSISDSLDWAIKHILRYGDTDIFPFPFEYTIINKYWDDFKKELMKGNYLKNNYLNYNAILVPKTKYGLRICKQLDPLQTIKYTALIKEIGYDIENCRINKDDEIVFSHRFEPDDMGNIWHPGFNYRSFIEYAHTKAKNYKYILLTDISDYYNRIYFHDIQNTLEEVVKNKVIFSEIEKYLQGLNSKVSIGIPVGQNASRLLSELILNDIDKRLVSEKVTFCRYNDDYIIFNNNQRKIYNILNNLANYLYENLKLTLNNEKTRILSCQDYLEEYEKKINLFKINDNYNDRLDDILTDLGIDDIYEFQDDNNIEMQNNIKDKLNIKEIYDNQLKNYNNGNLDVIKGIIKIARSIQDESLLLPVINDIDRIYPQIRMITNYIISLKSVSKRTYAQIEKKLSKTLEKSFVGAIIYCRIWIHYLFSQKQELTTEKYISDNIQIEEDILSKRNLILTAGKMGINGYFRTNKIRNYSSVWLQRAFIAGCSTLPNRNKKFLYDSIQNEVSDFEKKLIDYFRENPLN